ncbi:hypothetical protein CKJ90_31490, partial [Klebsiella pneumoniae]
GVSPRRYQKFFFSTDERKDSFGNAEKYSTKYKNHIDIQFIDSYLDFEIESLIFLELTQILILAIMSGELIRLLIYLPA